MNGKIRIRTKIKQMRFLEYIFNWWKFSCWMALYQSIYDQQSLFEKHNFEKYGEIKKSNWMKELTELLIEILDRRLTCGRACA